ncbi:MAG: endonuclease MutS2 [Spirochaetes bacterium]|nr:endonuclease MutS2 [Spirochaetota bacterium]
MKKASIFINFDLSKIEFDKILNEIKSFSVSEKGREKIENIKIENDYDKIIKLHVLLNQLKTFFISEEKISLNVIYNFNEQLIDSIKNRVLDEISLYQLSYSINIYFILRKKLDNIKYPELITLFNIKKISNEFYKEILKFINEAGYIDSKASKELLNIRNRLNDIEVKIKKATDFYFKKLQQSGYTVDDMITYKDGFNCIAVKSNYKNKVDGIAIDSSNSGQTVYMVPNTVITLHNELIQLKEEEKKEIYRICKHYSDIIKEEYENLKIIDKDLIEFDVLYAKTNYCHLKGYNSPEIIKKKQLNIIEGRHPLLSKEVVPLNFKIGNEYNILIITGPNTGGKTVVLKTVGLFVLMVQTGIAIPASSSSQFCIFDKIFLDIGDEQSIEQSLSTFSAHMLKIKDIINKSDGNTLILMDEFCSGTDPIEGSALAISIIEKLLLQNPLAVVTTHYSSLKIFASQKKGVMNASMEFDNEKLIPTYKLQIGIPGNSKAFDISRRLGIPEEIIINAMKNINQDYLNVDKLINKLEIDRIELENKKNEIMKKFDYIKDQKNELLNYDIELKEKEKKLNELLKIKESNFLKEARKEFENLVKKIKSQQASKESIRESKDFINKIEDNIIEKSKIINDKNKKQLELKKGDEVLIISKNVKGFIIDKANIENQYIVQTGFIKMNFDAGDLKLLENENRDENIASFSYDMPRKQLTLDIRGLRFEEAERKIEKFIEDAITGNVKTVRVIHGMGTGVLKSCLHDYCIRSPYVENFEYEKTVESDSTNFGTTVVYLK